MAGRLGVAELNAIAPESLDQALFGYADGHRQIASSLRLPPTDLYLLSTATDLAGGARLGNDDSYLSGLFLPESRKYALFRTWAAPEMPRPGCVWSHVILLGQKTAASLAAFSTLMPLFRRPDRGQTDGYDEALGKFDIDSGKVVDVTRIADIIGAYYTGKRVVLSSAGSKPADTEAAILPVWSQQWPRLRSMYSFCTASVKEAGRADASECEIQVAGQDDPHPIARDRTEWMAFAAADAARNRVTPLRRFLWRYGRDIANPRRNYRMLFELFERWGDIDEIPTEIASGVIDGLADRADGAILKRDLMRLGPSKPRLIAQISASDFLRLLPSAALPETPTVEQVARRLPELKPADAGVVARFYDSNREALAPWNDTVNEAVARHVDRSTILSDFPRSMYATVLRAREDLVDEETLSKVADAALLQFPRDADNALTKRYLLPELLRRNLGDEEQRIIAENPDFVFATAVKAYTQGRLNNSWSLTFSSFSEKIVEGPEFGSLSSTGELAAALAILRYPRRLPQRSDELSQRLDGMNDDAQGPDRVNMQAALLRAAIDELSRASWELLVRILPQLRPLIVRGELPETAHAMLRDDLPHFFTAGYWDLDRRILLSLQTLYVHAPDPSVLDRLSLSAADRKIVLNEEALPRKPFARFWDLF